MLAIKIVNDILLTGEDDTMRSFIVHFKTTFQLGKVVSGPVELQFFELYLTQKEDRPVTIHADEKLQSLEPFTISRNRRQQSQQFNKRIWKKTLHDY